MEKYEKNKPPLKQLTALFIAWRVFLVAVLFIAIRSFPLQKNFLGGGLSNYLANPYLWSWINFDGEHFLSIAYRGYQPLTYFFFPLYPSIVCLTSKLFGNTLEIHAITGLILSNLFMMAALYGLFKLLSLDYKEKFVFLVITLLITFPTSFYFGSFYSESLFLALVVWSFYFARKQNWWMAGILGMFAGATRVVGIVMFPALISEAFVQYREKKVKPTTLAPLLLVPLGLIAYMIYLKYTTGDALEFFTNVAIYGEQRSTGLILLPQVLYRYIVKILPNINYDYFPVVLSTWLEFTAGVLFGIGVIMSFLKLRISYAIFAAAAYTIPTLSGSFSSMSRYVLIIFPIFIIYALYLNKLNRFMRIMVIIFQTIILTLAAALFLRGFWIA